MEEGRSSRHFVWCLQFSYYLRLSWVSMMMCIRVVLSRHPLVEYQCAVTVFVSGQVLERLRRRQEWQEGKVDACH